ncbi:SDR family oxidoreductase [Emticicia sp. TH156]|uniref:SDR family NAD(P)-dependent oxidoreductase n=1 Tax=Emticicia sp. TH156 TaxID=2067454 RepID=UPI000C78A86F|nr:SDR family oxidoreductase [Emticicia sp. TH156]PLK42484.1 oxidoreductase [Emticicia sp. TH156]
MSKKHQQPYALITGGTSGIGYELARLLAKDGHNLIIVARSHKKLDEAVRSLSSAYQIQVIPLAKDLFKRKAAFEVYDFVKSQGIEIDILINDAGQGQYGEFINTDLEREIDIIELNIISLVTLTKLFLIDMVGRKNGKILNLASIASKVPGPFQSVYHGTKAFVHSFTEAIRAEVKESGVVITSLLPGATATDFFRKANMLESKVIQDPGKLSDPADVALDGYKALLDGDDMVISGLKNKIQVAMSNLMPDEIVAEKMYNQQKPVEKDSE